MSMAAPLARVVDNRIICDDYLSLLSDIPDAAAQMVFTDPPYGIGYQNNFTHARHRKIAGDEAHFDYSALAREARRILRPGGVLLVFTGWSEYGEHFREVKSAGLNIKRPLIGQKRPSGKTDLYGSFQDNDDWLIFAVNGAGFRFRATQLLQNKRAGTIPNKGRKPVSDYKTRFPGAWFGPEYPWSTENPAALKEIGVSHPTVKGQRFCEWLIRLCSDPDDLVVDPFCGSGTIPAAAKVSGRRFMASEIDPEYHQQAVARIGGAC